MSCVCLRCFAYLVYVFSFFVGKVCLVNGLCMSWMYCVSCVCLQFFVGKVCLVCLVYVLCMSCVCLRCIVHLVYVFSFFVGKVCLVCLVYLLCMS